MSKALELLKAKNKNNNPLKQKDLNKFLELAKQNVIYQKDMETKVEKMETLTSNSIDMVKGVGKTVNPMVIAPKPTKSTKKIDTNLKPTKSTKKIDTNLKPIDTKSEKKQAKKADKNKYKVPQTQIPKKEDFDTTVYVRPEYMSTKPTKKKERFIDKGFGVFDWGKQFDKKFSEIMPKIGKVLKYTPVGQTMKATGKVLHSPFIERLSINAVSTMHGENAGKYAKPSTGNKGVDTAVDIIGSIAGYFTPLGSTSMGGGGQQIFDSAKGKASEMLGKYAPMASIKGSEAVAKIGGKAAEKIGGKATNVIAKMLSAGAEGAGSSVPITGIESMVQGDTGKESLTRLGTNIMYGAGFGASMKGLELGGGAALKKIKGAKVEDVISAKKKIKLTDKKLYGNKQTIPKSQTIEAINTKPADIIKKIKAGNKYKIGGQIDSVTEDSASFYLKEFNRTKTEMIDESVKSLKRKSKYKIWNNEELKTIAEKEVKNSKGWKELDNIENEIKSKLAFNKKVEQIRSKKITADKKANPGMQNLEANYKERVNQIKKSNFDSNTKNKMLKAEGMKHSAEKRKLMQGDSRKLVEGGLTEKELGNVINKEKSNYIGKSVNTPDGNGVITNNSFGKVGVKLKTGETKYFTKEKISEAIKQENINKVAAIKNINKDGKILKPSNKYIINNAKANLKDVQAAKNSKVDKYVDEFLKPTMGQGKEDGFLIKDSSGTVTGKVGYQSKNELWYQEFRQKSGKPPTKAELRKIAEEQLKDGVDTIGGRLKPDDEYLKLSKKESELLGNKKAIANQENLNKKVVAKQVKRDIEPIPEDVLRDPKKFDSHYGLDKDIKSIKQAEIYDKISRDMGKRIINKVGSENLDDVLKYYQKKYSLPEMEIKTTLKADSNYARTAKSIKPGEKVVIKINPNKPIETQIGAIRHEIEHIKDIQEGYSSINPTKLKGTMRESYGTGKHHKNYEYFEPDYLRRSMLKEFEKQPKSNIKPVETIENAKVNEGTITKTVEPQKPIKTNTTVETLDPKMKVSKHEQTVKNSKKTDPKFREYLENKKATEYEAVSNQKQWDEAGAKVKTGDKDEILNRIKSKPKADSQDTHDLMQLHKHYTEKGDLNKANEVLTELTLKGTSYGQASQAMAAWNKQSTEGMLLMATKNKVKTLEKTKIFKQKNVIKQEIENLRDTIKTLETNPLKNKKEIELNMKLLSGKEKTLGDVEAKILKVHGSGGLNQADYKYISEHFDNYKSEKFYQNTYKTELKRITKGNTPRPSQIKAATEKANRAKDVEFVRAMQRVADQEGATGREQFRAVQRILMLNSPRTLIRNNTSNSLNALVDIHLRENSIAPVIDYLASVGRTKSLIKPITQKATSGRTTVFAPIRKSIAYSKGLIKGSRGVLDDLKDSIKNKEWIDTNPSAGQFEAGRKRIFKNKIFNSADQMIRRMVTDRPFYEAAYASRIKELQIINKTKAVTDSMKQNAKLYSLDKVFQNDSLLARKVVNIRKQIPVIGDLIMPFAQTPSNLADKLIDYTPAGLAKIAHQFGTAKTKGFDSKLFVDRLSRTLSGSGLAVMGYFLAKNEVITGSLNKSSAKIRENEKAQGKQAYSVKIGDKFYSYDWMSPTGGILAGAADFYNSSSGKDNYGDMFEKGVIGASDTILNQSMLSGVLDMLSGYSPSAGIYQSIIGSGTQANPTSLKLMARMMDDKERETKDTGVLRTTANRMISGIPIARNTLPEKINVQGEAVQTKKYDSTFANFINTFVTPSNVSKENKNVVSKELETLYKQSKSSKGLIPVAPKTVKGTSEEMELIGNTWKNKKIEYKPKTAKERTEWQKYYGTEQMKAISELVNTYEYQSAEQSEKVRMIDSAMKKNGNTIKSEYLKKVK